MYHVSFITIVDLTFVIFAPILFLHQPLNYYFNPIKGICNLMDPLVVPYLNIFLHNLKKYYLDVTYVIGCSLHVTFCPFFFLIGKHNRDNKFTRIEVV
jgi:hypothetical protein